jgi:ubiquinol-cytochrome c reductase cytochrome c1 subunit
MARIISILVGLFFTVALVWSFINGAYTQITEPPAPTAEHHFHEHPEDVSFSFDGPFGKFDNQQLQRGFQVYKEVCAACHSLRYVAFRDLAALGYSDAEVKAIAKATQVPVYNKMTGEVETREGLPTDYFPPVAYAGAGTPPDLSLITKARHDGSAYVHSLLTGYQAQPAELLKEFPDSKTPDGLYYNPYFANLNLAMPPPLADGQVTYSDGTPATVDQMSKDVSAFLTWTAEPKLEKRHQTGWAVMIFLLFATVLGYLSYRNIWAGVKH